MFTKQIIKIKCATTNHEPNFIKDTNNITFIKNCKEDSDGDVPVSSDDVVIYTDEFVNKIDKNAKYNIALLLESPDYHRRYYDYIYENNNHFNLILTFEKKLLDRGENFKFNPYGTCWLHNDYINIWTKTKICSMVTTNKETTYGHKLRKLISNNISKGNNVDIYGGSFNNLPYMTSKAYTPEHSGRHITNGKIIALKDYMFSIVIESCKEDYYFSEKLIDCFLTGTIPIYYGCPSIYKFFNIEGIIMIDNLNDVYKVLNSINIDLYNERNNIIKENYEKAQKYKDFKINEEAILEMLNLNIFP